MNEEHNLSPTYLIHLEHRYNDIKQVLEGTLTLFPPDAVDENHLLESLELEFDYLAGILGFENLQTFIERIIKRYDEE